MNKDPSRFETNSLIWVTAFILANLRGTVIWDILKQGFGLTALPWIEVFVWVVLFVMAVRSLVKDDLVAGYVRLWRQNWILIIFMAIAFLSVFWSVSISASLYRSEALLFSSLIGAYIGTRYSLEDLLSILFRFGTLLLILCFALALFLPIVGAMMWEPYNGAWRGVFWHKNQFGGIAALFSMVFLISAFNEYGKKSGKPLIYIAFYLFSLVNIYFSKSAAGYMLCILMTFFVFLAFVWLRIRQRLKPIHYYGILGLGILALTSIFLNLDFVFGLFNRDASLTGRIPMWDYLIRQVVSQRPWFGYGFGAIWSFSSFRIATQQAVGWGFPVAIADNGFLEILLHLGIVGLLITLIILMIATVRSFRYAISHKTLAGFSPGLFMLYVFIANISFSFIAEIEVFIWLLIVAVLFMTLPSSDTFQPARREVG